MNCYDEIKSKIIDNEVYGRVKDYSKERNTVITYFEIGKLLNEVSNKNLTQRQLQEVIKNHEYDRLSDIAKDKLINKHKVDLPDMVPNPIIIKINDKLEKITEYALKELLLNI